MSRRHDKISVVRCRIAFPCGSPDLRIVRHIPLIFGATRSYAAPVHRPRADDQLVRFVADRLGKSTYVNIMPQYYPAYRAPGFPELSRRITDVEFRQAMEWGLQAGLRLEGGV